MDTKIPKWDVDLAVFEVTNFWKATIFVIINFLYELSFVPENLLKKFVRNFVTAKYFLADISNNALFFEKILSPLWFYNAIPMDNLFLSLAHHSAVASEVDMERSPPDVQ